jgi:hypothetical protein
LPLCLLGDVFFFALFHELFVLIERGENVFRKPVNKLEGDEGRRPVKETRKWGRQTMWCVGKWRGWMEWWLVRD